IGNVCKYGVLFLLASIPTFGIMGVAISMSFGVLLVTLLHLASLRRSIRFLIPMKYLYIMITLIVLYSIVGKFLQRFYIECGSHFIMLIIILLILFAFYIMFLFMLQFITKEELKQIPLLNKWL